MRLMEITDAPMQTHSNLSCRPADRVKSEHNGSKTYAHRIMTRVMKKGGGGFCARKVLVIGVNISKIAPLSAKVP
jgi:hypothetical protein